MPIESTEYIQTLTALTSELEPVGILEQTFTSEIMAALWRLRRCAVGDAPADIKVRTQTLNILRHSITELRTLQTERAIRIQLGVQDQHLGLADMRQIVRTLKIDGDDRRAERRHDNLQELEDLMAQSGPYETEPAETEPAETELAQSEPAQTTANSSEEDHRNSFCKTPANTPAVSTKVPRNAPCPCGSGIKYKKCCGNPAAGNPATIVRSANAASSLAPAA